MPADAAADSAPVSRSDPTTAAALMSFPRTRYLNLNGYGWPPFGPTGHQGSRALWAARNASRAWPEALQALPMDVALFRLACFDKVYEM